MTKQQTKSQKVGAIILNVVLGILILIGLLVLFSLLPFKGNYKLYSVMSGSMSPTIKTGAMVLVKPADNYQNGDIITFHSGTRKLDVTTHRINSIEIVNGQTEITTKGDANEDSDFTKITQDKVIGKVIGNISYIGYLLGYIKTLPGLLIIIIIPAVIIIYEEVKKVKEEMTKMIKERVKRKKEESEKGNSSRRVRNSNNKKSNKTNNKSRRKKW